MLAPRQADAPAARVTDGDRPLDVAVPAGGSLEAPPAPDRPLATAVLAGDLIPARPVRVLFGVWRN